MTTLDLTRVMAGPVIFSEDRCYRYVLTRVWDEGRPAVAWIGLNPSTADETKLDPTLRRVARFSDSWGYGAFVMLNLFAYRATEPRAMKRHHAPVGADNDEHIVREASRAALAVAAWGTHGVHQGRDRAVRDLLDGAGVGLSYLALSKGGHPSHPLYLSSELAPQTWEPGRA